MFCIAGIIYGAMGIQSGNLLAESIAELQFNH